jgi:hypothetical protein
MDTIGSMELLLWSVPIPLMLPSGEQRRFVLIGLSPRVLTGPSYFTHPSSVKIVAHVQAWSSSSSHLPALQERTALLVA